MSMGTTGWNTIPPEQAYPLAQRIAHAEQHVLFMAALGIREMELTISAHVAATYGVPEIVPQLKALKATFRNELSVSGEGK